MEPTEHNRRAWDEIHRLRAEALAGERGLPNPVRHALADLTEKRVLHLQCGTGEATAELAELGGIVTGVDSAGASLETARERWPSILWVQADPQALPRELRRGRFDLVYSGLGSLTVNCYLYDIRENREMRSNELIRVQSADKKSAVRMRLRSLQLV